MTLINISCFFLFIIFPLIFRKVLSSVGNKQDKQTREMSLGINTVINFKRSLIGKPMQGIYPIVHPYVSLSVLSIFKESSYFTYIFSKRQ